MFSSCYVILLSSTWRSSPFPKSRAGALEHIGEGTTRTSQVNSCLREMGVHPCQTVRIITHLLLGCCEGALGVLSIHILYSSELTTPERDNLAPSRYAPSQIHDSEREHHRWPESEEPHADIRQICSIVHSLPDASSLIRPSHTTKRPSH